MVVCNFPCGGKSKSADRVGVEDGAELTLIGRLGPARADDGHAISYSPFFEFLVIIIKQACSISIAI
jgi:hypothetical protein